jgi:hypothetical protein
MNPLDESTSKIILKQVVERHLETYRQRLDEFEGEFKKDPVHALEFSEQIFRAAAYVHFLEIIQVELRKDAPNTERVINILKHQVLVGSRYPRRSTMITSNLMSECQTVAAIALLEDLFDIKAFDKRRQG